MRGAKIEDLKDAASALVDEVVQDVQTPYYSKVAIVPYSMAVNVGAYAEDVRGPYKRGTCSTPGCSRYEFRNPYGDKRTFDLTTCVTERTGAEAFTDASPQIEPLGRNYASSSNPCLLNQIMPLSSSRSSLHQSLRSLDAEGSTGGHIGVAWGWYMISPNFGYLWPAASRPAAYGTKELRKVAVIMTDGEYNTVYCKGVISKDSTAGSGSRSDHIDCNAPNGGSYAQAGALCENMKAAGVIIYTVGFDVVDDQRARDLIANCATDSAHIYLPATGQALKDAFVDIGQKISQLRISR